MMKNDQLIMFQIGVLISEFINCNDMPNKMSDVAEIIFDNLGVEINRGDDLRLVYQRVVAAINERDELLELEDSFYASWMEEDLVKIFAEDLRKEIDADILNSLISMNQTERFDDAMKGIQ